MHCAQLYKRRRKINSHHRPLKRVFARLLMCKNIHLLRCINLPGTLDFNWLNNKIAISLDTVTSWDSISSTILLTGSDVSSSQSFGITESSLSSLAALVSFRRKSDILSNLRLVTVSLFSSRNFHLSAPLQCVPTFLTWSAHIAKQSA